MSKETSSKEDVKDPNKTEDNETDNQTNLEAEDPDNDPDENQDPDTDPDDSRANARIRELTDKVKLLERIADGKFNQSQNSPPAKLPELDEEIEVGVNARINQKHREVNELLGHTIDKIDELEAKQDIPNYRSVKDQIEDIRSEKARQGQYLKRVDAYELLLVRGKIKPSPTKKEGPKVKKTSGKQVVEQKTNVANRGSKKDIKDMTLQEKEQALEDLVF